MSNLHGKHILLGISGGIAAYKAAELTRLLVKAHAEVRICMTSAALEFITPLTLQALSGNQVHTDLFDTAAESAMGHIELAQWADSIVIAPATANTLAKITHGQADNLLTTLVLVSKAPLTLAPAMNQAMWHNPQTQENINALKRRGICVLGPAQGEQACGDTGFGRLLEPRHIIEQLTLNHADYLKGLTILITAGPTREALDPVRYITNRSSGKMGYSLAEAACQLGAKVTLISGPVVLKPPHGVETIRVESAQEMLAATQEKAPKANIFIASAAVADYSAQHIATDKIKKSAETMHLKLIKNPDILTIISHTFAHLFTVGFAAETSNLINHAKSKLMSKKLDMIAANLVGQQQGFEVDNNALEVLWIKKEEQTTEPTVQSITLPLTNKLHLAHQLLKVVYHQFIDTQQDTQ